MSTRGNVNHHSHEITETMGGYNVTIRADCEPAEGEWLIYNPTCTALYNNIELVSPVEMQPSSLEADRWVGEILGVYPRPDALKVEATFRDNEWNTSTVKDVKIIEPEKACVPAVPEPAKGNPCSFDATWVRDDEDVTVSVDITGEGRIREYSKPSVEFYLPGDKEPFLTGDLDSLSSTSYRKEFDNVGYFYKIMVTVRFKGACKPDTKTIKKTATQG